MGEQRLKALRGKKMDDIIFNGAEGAPPVGLAEVTITLVSDGKPFPGAYAGCSEVTVSRRLFREGESEYYINKASCRFLDVKEFFMDTGVGARAYSLVEQNSVYTLVEAKPEERRQLIEEAAGIAKYKSRKESALRKMEATKQNMVRLHDIIKEVKTQLNAVSRQAKRAEQYKNLKKEAREAELTLALKAYSEFTEEKTTLEKEKEALRDRETKLETEGRNREAALEEMKIAAREDEEIVADCQEKLYGVKNAINMKEQGIEFSQGRVADIASQKQRNNAEIKSCEGKLSEIAGEIKALKTAEIEAEREIMETRDALSANRTHFEELGKADDVLYDELEGKKAAYVDIATEKAKLKNMEAHLSKFIEDGNRRIDRHRKEMEENKKRCDSLRQALTDLRRELMSDEGRREERKGCHDILAVNLRESISRLREIEDKISALKEECGRKSTRLTSLQEFHEGYAWCSEGIKSIMAARKEGRLDVLGVDDFLGLVADHIDVPREYEAAVEAVLGEKLQYIVVKSQEDGVKAIDYLKTYAKGRGTFVPLAIRNHNPDLSLTDRLQGAVRLIDRIKVRDDLNEVVTCLLGDVLLIANLHAGITLWRQNGFRGTFVTPDGDLISPQGVLTGGSHAKGEKSLLADKREMAELKNILSHNSRELVKATTEKNEINRLICKWDEELQQVKAEVHRLEIQINGRRKDLERYEDEMKRINQRLGILGFDQETLLGEEKEALEKIEKLKKDHILQQEKEKAINDEMAALTVKRGALRTELEEWERAVTAGKVLLAAREEKREGDRKTVARLEATRGALVREISDKQRNAKTSDGQVEELRRHMAAERENLDALYKEYQVLEKKLAERRTGQQERDDLLKTLEREIREKKQTLAQVQREVNEREMSLRELLFQMDALKNSIAGKHHVDPDVLIKEYSPLEEGRIQELAAKLEKVRHTLENFGEVNLLALNEYEELKERYNFLTDQNEDIRASLDSLQRAIERINRISKRRFAETFEAVNVCFKEMFSRIFPGGKGELKLTNSANMLETGVDIDIQLPGKRAQNITLLSGGEKSLAAIALIFAVLRHRPAPFLVLDEVDAALDDANIALFNSLIRDISKNSQIIMVTHNKKTMEVAESLFGITMQNQGISTLVSVRLSS